MLLQFALLREEKARICVTAAPGIDRTSEHVCPFRGPDGRTLPVEASVWKTLLPLAMALVLTIIGAAWSIGGRIASLELSLTRLESAFTPKEVLMLQLETLRLEIRAVDLKITTHMTLPQK